MIKGTWNIFSFLTSFVFSLTKGEWSYRIRVIVLAKKKCFLGAISGGGRLSKTWFWTLRTTQHGSWRRQHELRRFGGVHSIRLLGRELLERVHFESFLCETFLYYDCIVVLLHIDCWQSPILPCVRRGSLIVRVRLVPPSWMSRPNKNWGEYKNYVSFSVPASCPVRGPSAVYPLQFYRDVTFKMATKLVEPSGWRNTRKTADCECLFYT